MIRSAAEYEEAVRRVKEDRKFVRAERARLMALGLKPIEVTRALAPMKSFQSQLAHEVRSYERLRRGEFEELSNFSGLGRTLIALRVYVGMSQRELAQKLGVHESQVSRDERNEYNGVTVERASGVLEALGVELRTLVERVPRSRSSA